MGDTVYTYYTMGALVIIWKRSRTPMVLRRLNLGWTYVDF